ncbi:ubiquinone biosynthesis protein coq4 homolog, mitochondrial [Plakobranchus ocellatus]|uniref:Ubiquinone biosynthesis protein coq4 homolog, mitochondrial n=1 Tax=Plakobranchus ocellatus TaxID=259542 RepID=A0AAV4ALV3_9GAST|nr:ubiquinone biosynthesis protein coq4 homolog, mitochondrial [Plakobranchus ocellatus]
MRFSFLATRGLCLLPPSRGCSSNLNEGSASAACVFKNNVFRKSLTAINCTLGIQRRDLFTQSQKKEDSNSHQSAAQYNVRYPGHITTTRLQKAAMAFGSAYACLTDPARDGKGVMFALNISTITCGGFGGMSVSEHALRFVGIFL